MRRRIRNIIITIVVVIVLSYVVFARRSRERSRPVSDGGEGIVCQSTRERVVAHTTTDTAIRPGILRQYGRGARGPYYTHTRPP